MPCFLVIQLARFGDIIQTARLIESLLTEGEVHLCVDRSLIELAKIVYPQCTIHSVIAHQGISQEVFKYNYATCITLSQYTFTQVFNINYSGLNQAISTLFPPEIVRGYATNNGQPLRERWMKMAFRWTTYRKHSPLNLVDFWGLLAPNPIAPNIVNPIAKPGGKGLGVVLAGRHARRSLPPEILAPIISMLFEQVEGKRIFLLGSKLERPIGRQLMSLLPRSLVANTHNLAGKTNWHELTETVSNLDLIITPDTGTMHLAARLGVPICAMFLSSAWAWETGPYGKGHQVWQAITDCAPCVESKSCMFGLRCLKEYSSLEFYRHLSGVSQQLPSNIDCLTSSFDTLGLIWESKQKQTDIIRVAQRTLLKEYKGVAIAKSKDVPVLADGQLAMNLYHEADWMLPDIIS